MDMSFSPNKWPQLRSGPRVSDDSAGPEWRDLLARLGAAQAASIALDDAGRPGGKGSFSPCSARHIEDLGETAEKDDRAVNQGISGNGNGRASERCEEAGNQSPGHARN